MPIFQLPNEIVFPPVHLAHESGILAVGGDLTPERLLAAYREGIFPWYSPEDPILWWSPDPRFVLYPAEIRIARTMRQVLRRNIFTVTFDRAFRDVVAGCRTPRKTQAGTWITDEMLEAYCLLHERGYAHSVEAWREGALAGGLYGVSLGGMFFGESMFARESNASKAALVTLAEALGENGFDMIDCQVYTGHLESLGAREIPRTEFMTILRSSLERVTLRGNWGELSEFSRARDSEG
ncbi:MAG: leucyl/phenylalanyl-tRNA--protein transferase [Spirochaetes bacterium]|nr:MAG: leucyl/phenylalanyl-tRNA--protein transferase [Spirochaetota bacterium]